MQSAEIEATNVFVGAPDYYNRTSDTLQRYLIVNRDDRVIVDSIITPRVVLFTAFCSFESIRDLNSYLKSRRRDPHSLLNSRLSVVASLYGQLTVTSRRLLLAPSRTRTLGRCTVYGEIILTLDSGSWSGVSRPTHLRSA